MLVGLAAVAGAGAFMAVGPTQLKRLVRTDWETCSAGIERQWEACSAVLAKPGGLDRDRLALANLNLGKTLAAQGRWDDAETYLQTSLVLDSNQAKALALVGVHLGKKGRYDEALMYMERAEILDAGMAGLFANRCWIQRSARNFPDALADCDKALSLGISGDLAQLTYANRGEALRESKRYPEAVRDLTEALALKPGDAFSLSRRGAAHRQAGNLDAALSDLDAALGVDPRNAFALAHRGDTHLDRQDAASAGRDLDAALKLEPRYPYALVLRGWLRIREGDPAKALPDLDAAVRENGSYALAYAFRGEAYRMSRSYARAMADFDKALRIDPRHAWTIERRETLLKDIAKEGAPDTFKPKIVVPMPESYAAVVKRGWAISASELAVAVGSTVVPWFHPYCGGVACPQNSAIYDTRSKRRAVSVGAYLNVPSRLGNYLSKHVRCTADRKDGDAFDVLSIVAHAHMQRIEEVGQRMSKAEFDQRLKQGTDPRQRTAEECRSWVDDIEREDRAGFSIYTLLRSITPYLEAGGSGSFLLDMDEAAKLDAKREERDPVARAFGIAGRVFLKIQRIAPKPEEETIREAMAGISQSYVSAAMACIRKARAIDGREGKLTLRRAYAKAVGPSHAYLTLAFQDRDYARSWNLQGVRRGDPGIYDFTTYHAMCMLSDGASDPLGGEMYESGDLDKATLYGKL